MAKDDVEDTGANWWELGRLFYKVETLNYDRKMCWWCEDEKDFMILEWQEKRRELNVSCSEWEVSEDMKGILSGRESSVYWILPFKYTWLIG